MNWNPFYLVWSDAIRRVRKSNPGMKDWKWKIFLYMTTIQALNFWLVLLWLKYFEIINVETLRLDILPGGILDGFISFAVVFASPFVILNFFTIFHKNRYEKILEKYNKASLWYSPFYMFSIPILAFISAILYGILTR